MTTIAYCNGVLVCDTQSTSGGARDGIVSKIWAIPQGVIAITGSLGLCYKIVNALAKGDEEAIEQIRKECSANNDAFDAILVKDDGVFVYDDYMIPMDIRADFYAEGSGRNFALGAMSAGAHVEDAVKIACKHDVKSGEPVIVVNVPTELTRLPSKGEWRQINYEDGFDPIRLTLRS